MFYIMHLLLYKDALQCIHNEYDMTFKRKRYNDPKT